MSCPQIWNIYRARERESKRETGRQASEAQREKLKGDRQNTKEKFFAARTTRKFCSGGDKMRNVSGHQCKVKMSGREKKVNEDT